MFCKSAFVVTLALAGLCVIPLAFHTPQAALAQESIKTGTLEGTVVDSEGEPIPWDGGNSEIELYLDGQFAGGYRLQQGSRYHIENLKKGVYQMVFAPWNSDVRKRDRVKRYLGLLIKPGKALQLNVKLSKGQGVEQIGEDAIEYPSVIIVSEALEKLQKQIDDLKVENEDLKKQVAELKKK